MLLFFVIPNGLNHRLRQARPEDASVILRSSLFKCHTLKYDDEAVGNGECFGKNYPNSLLSGRLASEADESKHESGGCLVHNIRHRL